MSGKEWSVYQRPKCVEEMFHQAVLDADMATLSAMVEQGVDVCWTDPMGWAALHLASREQNMQVVQFLVEHGAEVNGAGLNKWTALHYACHSGCDDIIKFLVENGADKSAKTVDGRAPRDMCITWAMKKYLYDIPEYQVEYERWLYAKEYHERLAAMEQMEQQEWEKLKQQIEANTSHKVVEM